MAEQLAKAVAEQLGPFKLSDEDAEQLAELVAAKVLVSHPLKLTVARPTGPGDDYEDPEPTELPPDVCDACWDGLGDSPVCAGCGHDHGAYAPLSRLRSMSFTGLTPEELLYVRLEPTRPLRQALLGAVRDENACEASRQECGGLAKVVDKLREKIRRLVFVARGQDVPVPPRDRG